MLVAAWGGWLSIGASRRGPGWARAHLQAWRGGPWLLALVGVGSVLTITPIWVGLGILYIAGVTGLLMRQVRRRLEVVEDAYGPFHAPADRPSTRRTGTYLLIGGAALAVLGAVDLAVRGWSGVFAVALAGILSAAGVLVRRG